jgi:hypothetical protein
MRGTSYGQRAIAKMQELEEIKQDVIPGLRHELRDVPWQNTTALTTETEHQYVSLELKLLLTAIRKIPGRRRYIGVKLHKHIEVRVVFALRTGAPSFERASVAQ